MADAVCWSVLVMLFWFFLAHTTAAMTPIKTSATRNPINHHIHHLSLLLLLALALFVLTLLGCCPLDVDDVGAVGLADGTNVGARVVTAMALHDAELPGTGSNPTRHSHT